MKPETAEGLPRFGFVVLLAGSLLIRLAIQWVAAGDPIFDLPMLDAEYAVDWAKSVRAGDVWGSPENTAYFRTPLYAWLLALVFALPGPDLVMARGAQALMGALAAGWLAEVSARRFGRTAGWITGVLAAVSWPLLFFGRELLIVPVAFFLGAAVLRVADRAGPRAGRWLAIGLLIGLGAVARANFLIVGIPIAAYAILGFAREGRRRRLAALTLGVALCVAPITVRNRVVSGDWVLLSSQGGLNLWIGNHPHADGMTAGLPGFSSWRNEDVAATLAREYGRAVSASEQDAHYRRLALNALRTEPGAVLRGLLRKTYFFLQGYEIRNNTDLYAARERHGILRLPMPDFGWVLPLALLGFAVTWRRRRELVHVWGYGLAMAAGVIIFFVCSRYRLPAWPAFLIYAGAGGAALIDGTTPWPRRVGLGLGLAAAVLVARIDFLDIRDPDPSQPHYQYGNSYARADRFEDAEREFREAIRLRPAFGEARHHLGALLLRQERLAEALPELTRAVADLPRSFRARRSLAEALEASGKTKAALTVRREVAELTARRPEALLALATTLGMSGDYPESMRLFLELEPHAAELGPYYYLNAGLTALAIGRESEGTRWLTRAREDPETQPAALKAESRFYLSFGRWDDALRLLNPAVLRDPDHAENRRLRASARYYSGDPTGAIEDLERVLAIDPSDAASRERLQSIRDETPSR